MGDGKAAYALIVIDMTQEQCGWLGPNWSGCSNILQLAKAFPPNRVFDSRLEFDPKQPENSLRVLYPNIGLQGTSGAQLVPELKSIKATYVKKVQYSAFFESKLEQMLRDEKVTTVILCGIQTDFCVFATALDAFNLGFHVGIVEDACEACAVGGHQRGLSEAKRFLGCYCHIVSTSDVLKAV